jgi:UDP-N-acetylmuramate--alanine ligase
MIRFPFPQRHLYLIGIGGTGLSNIAHYLLSCGYKISGSDIQQNPATKWLKNQGIKIFHSHKPSNISKATGLIIKSAAIKDDNPEIKEAECRKIPIIKYAQVLGLLMASKTGIAVSGTHGKTTTASLIAYLLSKAKLNPSFIIGGVLQGLNTGAHSGCGNYFIAEACEYDRSFHYLPAKIKVITNIEMDHMEYYKTFNNLIESFHQFIATTSSDGFVIANTEIPGVRKCLKKQIRARVITYGSRTSGFSGSEHWKPKNIHIRKSRWHFEVWKNRQKYGDFANIIAGEHNVLNAIAGIIVCDILKIDKNVIRQNLLEFKGVHRRFEVIARVKGRIVIDDYGHHPTELRAVIETARNVFPDKRLWLVFQPHLYSRTRLFLNEFANVLSKADVVLIPPIYAARDIKPSQQIISSQDLVDKVNEYERVAMYFPDFDSIVKYLLEQSVSYDVIITVGAGDVWKIGQAVAK